MQPSEMGALIRHHRRAMNLRQQDLAELAEVSERFVRDLEQGKTTLRLDKLIAVCTTLGLRLTIEGA